MSQQRGVNQGFVKSKLNRRLTLKITRAKQVVTNSRHPSATSQSCGKDALSTSLRPHHQTNMSEHEHLGFTFVGKLKSHCPQVSRESKVDDIVEAWLVELPLDPRRQAGRQGKLPMCLVPQLAYRSLPPMQKFRRIQAKSHFIVFRFLASSSRSDAELRTIFQEART